VDDGQGCRTPYDLPMLDRKQPHDLAVSFAGKQRPLAEEFVRACEALGLDVFYDRNVSADVWGYDIAQQFRRFYNGELARYMVAFLSEDYLAGAYPMDEFDAALTYSLQRRDDPFLLPITFGDVRIPENLLRSSVAFLRAEDYSAAGLARITADRVRRAGNGVAAPSMAAQARPLRTPGVAPVTFSQIGTLEAGLARLAERFRAAAPELGPFGYSCHVRLTNSSVDVRVEAQGSQVYGLRVQLQNWLGADKLTMSFGWPTLSGSGINAWAAAEWDSAAGEGRLRFSDFGGMRPDRLMSADELFDALWEKVVNHIEQTHGRRR
jgi:hypothetical protein